MQAHPSTFAVLRRRDFRMLWTSQLISAIGSAFTTLAASILVFRLTGSALNVSLLLIATAIPGLVLGPFAGVCADRFDRKHIMIISDLLRAALIAAIPLGLYFGLWWLYALIILVNMVRQFFDPAYASLLPETAVDEELTAANALMSMTTHGTTAIGFALSGLIATHFSIEWAFYLDALSFVLSALFVTRIQNKPLVVDDAENAQTMTITNFLSDLRVGVKFVVQTPILRSLFLLYMPVILCFGFINAVLLPFTVRALHASEFDYSLLEGLWSVGFLIGSLWMARLANRLSPSQWLTLGLLLIGLCNISFALSHTLPLSLAIYMLYGGINAPVVIARQLIMQRATPREIRGRVNSTLFVMGDTLSLLGMAGAGLADWFNIRLLYLLIGGVVLLVCGLCTPHLPGLRSPATNWRRYLPWLKSVSTLPDPAARTEMP